jgi:hypothetical protein
MLRVLCAQGEKKERSANQEEMKVEEMNEVGIKVKSLNNKET